MDSGLQKDYEKLCKITAGCRPDMHEPDEQGVSVELVDGDFDNAMLDDGEAHVIIRDRHGNEEKINLACLIALARMAVSS